MLCYDNVLLLEFKSFVSFTILSFERNSHEGEMLMPLQMHDTMDPCSRY